MGSPPKHRNRGNLESCAHFQIYRENKQLNRCIVYIFQRRPTSCLAPWLSPTHRFNHWLRQRPMWGGGGLSSVTVAQTAQDHRGLDCQETPAARSPLLHVTFCYERVCAATGVVVLDNRENLAVASSSQRCVTYFGMSRERHFTHGAVTLQCFSVELSWSSNSSQADPSSGALGTTFQCTGLPLHCHFFQSISFGSWPTVYMWWLGSMLKKHTHAHTHVRHGRAQPCCRGLPLGAVMVLCILMLGRGLSLNRGVTGAGFGNLVLYCLGAGKWVLFQAEDEIRLCQEYWPLCLLPSRLEAYCGGED